MNFRIIAVAMVATSYLTLQYYIQFFQWVSASSLLYGFMLGLNSVDTTLSNVAGLNIIFVAMWFIGIFGLCLFASSLIYAALENFFVGILKSVASEYNLWLAPRTKKDQLASGSLSCKNTK